MITDPLSQTELRVEIVNVHSEFTQLLSQLSELQINKILKEESWSAGQVAEHIIKSNGGILSQLLNGAAQPSTRPFDEKVGLIRQIFRREEKMKTAPILEPSLPPHHLEDLMKSLNQQKDQQLETIKEKELDELSNDLQFPPAPNGLTRYEWIIFMIEHTRRHLKQLEAIYNEIHTYS
jgi:hypothetical protein